MNKAQKKIWRDECDKIEKEKGYLPAELQLLPLFVDLSNTLAIDIAFDDDDNTYIGSPGIFDDKDPSEGMVDDGSWEDR